MLKITEAQLSTSLHRLLQLHESQNSLKAVYAHVPNEGKRSKVYASNLKKQGLIAGAGDFVFTGENFGCWLELKAGTNDLTHPQELFRYNCIKKGVPYAVGRRLEDIELQLLEWGVVTKLLTRDFNY